MKVNQNNVEVVWNLIMLYIDKWKQNSYKYSCIKKQLIRIRLFSLSALFVYKDFNLVIV